MATWTCPYCRQKADLEEIRIRSLSHVVYSDAAEAYIIATRCLNPECRKVELTASLDVVKRIGNYLDHVRNVKEWRLVPNSRALPWPEYVTPAIVEDYNQACLIEYLSPKGSAALSRRCLQALIRDFFGISKRSLVDEINEVAESGTVSPDLAEALHAIREIGNVGAHPDRDPSIIADVEPGEATAMIDLLELVIQETYVARHNRDLRIDRAKQIMEAKEAAGGPPASA